MNNDFNVFSVKKRISVCLILTMVFLTGCVPLRKKFTRTKRPDQITRVEPILTPIDYEKENNDPRRKYSYYYSMFSVNQRDLLNQFERSTRDSDKRQKLYVDDMLLDLTEMIKVLDQGNKSEAEVILNELKQVRNMFNVPAAARNEILIVNKVKRIASKVRNVLSPRKLWPDYAG